VLVLSFQSCPTEQLPGWRTKKRKPFFEEMDLRETQVTGTGLQYLAALSKLRWIRLRNSQVADAGLVYLQNVPQLKWLQMPIIAIQRNDTCFCRRAGA